MAMTFERSPDTDATVDVLQAVNGEIAYADLARRAGLSLKRLMQVLPSARRIHRNTGILFGVIRGVGLKRMSDSDKVRKPEAFKQRVFRGAGRELKDLGHINYEPLSQTEQHSVTINKTVLNAMRQQAAVKPEAPKVKTAAQPMPDVSN